VCPSTQCSLWPYRFGKNPKRSSMGPAASITVAKNMTAAKAIRLRCVDCYEFARKDCGVADCELHTVGKARLRS